MKTCNFCSAGIKKEDLKVVKKNNYHNACYAKVKGFENMRKALPLAERFKS